MRFEIRNSPCSMVFDKQDDREVSIAALDKYLRDDSSRLIKGRSFIITQVSLLSQEFSPHSSF